MNWASSDWNIAIGIHGNQWEIVSQKVRLPKVTTVYAVVDNLREGYGYWARTRGEKKLRPLPSSAQLPLILEITKPGLAFVNPGLLQNESPQKLFSHENGIEFVWQYDPNLKQWSYFSTINAASGDAALMQEVIAGLPFWIKTSRAQA